jgi:hypothetical protein
VQYVAKGQQATFENARHNRGGVATVQRVSINGGFLLAAAPLAHRPELLLIAL